MENKYLKNGVFDYEAWKIDAIKTRRKRNKENRELAKNLKLLDESIQNKTETIRFLETLQK